MSRVGLAAGERGDRRLHAPDMAAVVGTKHIDHCLEAASELVAVIGDVAGEIGVAAVGLDQRPVDVVAEIGGAEQELLAVLPILVDLALGRRQPALIDEPLGLEVVDGLGDLVARTFAERALGEKHVVADAELSQIVLDHDQHRL